MCRLAAADGCEAMVATPHQRRGEWWNADREQLAALADELQDAVGAGFRVYLGGEIHVDSELLAEVEQLPGGRHPAARRLALPADRVRLERHAGEAIHLVHELVVAGWRPIVAHPEFIPWLAPDPELVARLVALGAHHPGDRDERHRRLRPPAPGRRLHPARRRARPLRRQRLARHPPPPARSAARLRPDRRPLGRGRRRAA